MKNICRKLLLTLVSLSLGSAVMAQGSIKPVEAMVNKKFAENLGYAPSVKLFSVDPQSANKSSLITKDLKDKSLLKLDEKLNDQLLSNAPDVLSLNLPSKENFELQLVKQEVTTFDFSVVTDQSNGKAIDYKPGLHYRGIVKNLPGSLVSISILNGEVMGLISTPEGNYNLGKMEGLDKTYVLYNDKNLSGKKNAPCETPEMPEGFTIKIPDTDHYKATVKCVKVYIETDYDLYQNKGSATAVSDYITGLFNQVATLYQNESITTQISQIYVWTSNDPYSGNSSSNYLSAFRSTRTTYNGDIAHLVNLTGNLGGVAYVDVICNKSYGYAFSCISPSYNSVPTYSWSVEVFTHEMGHNLGSPHTQSCSWQGGALDNCYTTEGGCPAGPAPTNGGTIMSYCHLTSYGINFNNGFGQQPGNLIRSRVSTATCLGTCETGGPITCNPPGGIGTSGVSSSGFTINWSAAPNAVSYDVRYKAASSSTWVNSSTSNTSMAISGLSASTTYNYEVRSNCGSGNYSAYSASGSVTTSAVTVSYCASKGNSTKEWIAKVVMGSISNSTGANSGYGNFTSLSTSGTPGSSVSFNLTPGFPSGGALGLTKKTQPEYWRVWVDFNRDGDFTDAGEQVYSSTSSSTGQISGSFVIPVGAAVGNTRIRVSMKRNAVASPCETFSYGEVEDYTLSVVAASPASGTSAGMISEALSELKTLIYPNPSEGVTNLQLEIPARSGLVTMSVIDLTGKKVNGYSWSVEENDLTVNHLIDMSNQPKGIYLVEIADSAGNRKMTKLIVR